MKNANYKSFSIIQAFVIFALVLVIALQNNEIDELNAKLVGNGNVELKNCPLCGGEAKIVSAYDYWKIECKECGLDTDIFKSEDKAVKRWNDRVGEEDVL